MAEDAGVIVTIDVKGMERFKGKLNSGGTSAGPVRDMYTQWAFRLRSQWKERFDTNSKGGGTWKGLAESTKAQRMRAKSLTSGTLSILRVTNTLFRAIDPKANIQPGRLTNRGKNFIEIGYGGNAKHPAASVTVQQLAMWHQTGAGHLPVRTIIVGPNSRTQEGMKSDADRALAKLSKETGNQ